MCSGLRLGGTERFSSWLAKQFVDAGHDVSVSTFDRATNDFYALPSRVHRIELDVLRQSRHPVEAVTQTCRRLHALRATIRTYAPDVCVGLGDITNILLLMSTVGMKIRIVISDRTNHESYPIGFFWEVLRRILYRRAHVHVAQSIDAMRWLSERLPSLKQEVIPNPVPMPASRMWEPRIGRRDQPVRVLFVGRLSHYKGVDIALRAMAALKGTLSRPVILTVCGNGPELEHLRALADEYGIVEDTIFQGEVRDVASYYKEADIFVLPSRFEGFPNVLLEAMSYGLPCVVSDVRGGIRDVFDRANSSIGFRVEPASVTSLAAALRLLIEDANLRSACGKAAFCCAHDYSEGLIGTRWLDCLK